LRLIDPSPLKAQYHNQGGGKRLEQIWFIEGFLFQMNLPFTTIIISSAQITAKSVIMQGVVDDEAVRGECCIPSSICVCVPGL